MERRLTAILAAGLGELGHAVVHDSAFDTLCIDAGDANAAIAARAGTTTAAIYRRWSGKAQLVHEAVLSAETVELPVTILALSIHPQRHALRCRSPLRLPCPPQPRLASSRRRGPA